MIKEILNSAEDKMQKVVEVLRRDYGTLRAGRANPSVLDRITVEYYGADTPINQLANISVPEPRLIVIQPWDKKCIAAIEKAILKSDLGITPANDGTVVRLPFPQLTEERRRELVKVAQKKAEDAKVAVRNIRRNVNEDLKALEKDKSKQVSEDEVKDALDDVQKLTDNFIKKMDEVFKQKENEIMEV